MSQIYDFSINSLSGKVIDFADFRGKVVLIVNTASKCGYTPQYTGLQKLHEKYSEKGLVIIGFPCNQFGGQEPGDAETIQSTCLVNYGVTFLITEKIDVNGDNAHPIFTYLKESLPIEANQKAIKWNFTKFLIDTDGNPVKRFASAETPEMIEQEIVKLL